MYLVRCCKYRSVGKFLGHLVVYGLSFAVIVCITAENFGRYTVLICKSLLGSVVIGESAFDYKPRKRKKITLIRIIFSYSCKESVHGDRKLVIAF